MKYIVAFDQITQTVAPSVEPVTLAEVKAHLRVDGSDEDDLLSALIVGAREWAENYTGRAFVDRTLRVDIPDFYDDILLPFAPVSAIVSVQYWDTSSPSVQQTLSSDIYDLNRDTVYRKHGESWECVYPRPDAVSITFKAGYASNSSPEDITENIPQSVKQAMLLAIGDMYENREGKIIGVSQSTNPTVLALLHPYRLYR